MFKRAFAIGLVFFFIVTGASAQKPELTITLNEQFFDALLDSVFKNFDAPEFSIAASSDKAKRPVNYSAFSSTSICKETIQLLRENNGVRTTVRFRDGKIYAPLAFTGNYSPPFVGCVGFSGYAETNIDLEFDQDSQRLIARAKVLNVALNGTGGVGGGVVAKLVQSSIDKKINPIEIIRMDKLSFLVPVQNGASLRMKAVGMRHEIGNGILNVIVAYEFTK
ncbi:MAG: hypothetical protein WBD27_16730 [Pyrinomonadaceae bacterium]